LIAFKTILRNSVLIAGVLFFTACAPRSSALRPSQPTAHKAKTKHRIKRGVAQVSAPISKSSGYRVASKSHSKSSRRGSTSSRRKHRSSYRSSSRSSYNASKPEPYSIESGEQDPEVLGPEG
jgi:hypothetical protein